MPLPRPGNLKDPQVAGLFNGDDPEKTYTDLREIGHGSFGAVYFARHIQTKEVVAIKKMSYSGKGSQDKWQDIIKEVRFLEDVKHENTIEYKGCYLKDHTAWLVMEYCLGSASDIVEVHKKPLKEVEISAICEGALQGLLYLHGKAKIHRDIKAGNILLTEDGTVKLADFGSASLMCPANSFVGTPYWMAPEVILAMDEGQYDGKADIWSLGITCIELAERKPPLFNMNAMSALYHIAQNDSPTLSHGEWSDEFHNFVDVCLQKSPADRPTANDCLSHPFVRKTRRPDVLSELILRTKEAVRKLDNLQYRRMKKLIMNGNDEPAEGVPAVHSPHLHLQAAEGIADEDISVGDDTSSQDEDQLDSKSGSLASQHSANYASSQSSLTSLTANHPDEFLPPAPSTLQRDRSPPLTTQLHNLIQDWPSLSSRSGSYSPQSWKVQASGGSGRSSEVPANNFATIRTTSIVRQEIKQHAHSNEYRNFTIYKRLRKQHQKELQSMESRFKGEMEEHKQKLDREYENLRAKCSKELDRLKANHNSELERHNKNTAAQEKKLMKDTSQTHENEKRNLNDQTKRNNKEEMDKMKKGLDTSASRREREDMMRVYKETLAQKHREAELQLEKQQRDMLELSLRKFKRRAVLSFHTLQQKLLKEEMGQRKAQVEYEHCMLVRHHESTQDLEYKHLAALQKCKDEQLKRQHETERENQKDYNARAEQELRKKHALEVKQQPRSLKAKEIQIRKQFNEAVKTQQRQYKALKEHILQTTPKPEQKSVVKKLKEEQMRKLAALGDQYEASIAEMLQQQNVRLDESQVGEAGEMRTRLQQEMELLTVYQSKVKENADAQHHRERKVLEERVSLRRALLEQKMEEERAALRKEEAEKWRVLRERQQRELEKFDGETKALGLNAAEVVAASQDPQSIDDQLSVRGSSLSLSASSSTNSFTAQTPL
ncbi:serine/threonine-protein kinase TAO3-like isoform X2 [Babylonia areolata]|uniref:serine/threonine-protein kinase TAO3-like isoform X2 n=1 Tax=Babylonia areolata TaxID=304850 RepID=UPI003FD51F94